MIDLHCCQIWIGYPSFILFIILAIAMMCMGKADRISFVAMKTQVIKELLKAKCKRFPQPIGTKGIFLTRNRKNTLTPSRRPSFLSICKVIPTIVVHHCKSASRSWI